MSYLKPHHVQQSSRNLTGRVPRLGTARLSASTPSKRHHFAAHEIHIRNFPTPNIVPLTITSQRRSSKLFAILKGVVPMQQLGSHCPLVRLIAGQRSRRPSHGQHPACSLCAIVGAPVPIAYRSKPNTVGQVSGPETAARQHTKPRQYAKLRGLRALRAPAATCVRPLVAGSLSRTAPLATTSTIRAALPAVLGHRDASCGIRH